MAKVKIGVMGCAAIAYRSVIPAILALKDQFELVAVASRTKEKAQQYAKQFNCDGIVGYDKLLERTDVDAIYMPLPTGLHQEWVLKCLQAGKHVYAEKSIAMNFTEAEAMVSLARRKNLVLIEGYMFRYHAQHQKVFELLNSGIIGDIRHFSASFGFPPLSHENFRYDPIIGGGALLDCAGYTVSASSFILQQIPIVRAASVFYDERGTSIYGSAFLETENQIGIALAFGFDNYYQCSYSIWGSKGKIFLKKAFTPKADEITTVQLELPGDTICFTIAPDNHFVHIFEKFHQFISGTGRDKCFSSILEQSKTLTEIERISRI